MVKGLALGLLSALVIVASVAAASAKVIKYQLSCDYGRSDLHPFKAHILRENGAAVTLAPSGINCTVSVSDVAGRSVFEYTSWGLDVFVGRGVTADPKPVAIIQADSSPYKLFIFSLEKSPRLIKTIHNQYGFWLQDDCEGVKLWTSDGAFQEFPELSGVYLKDLFVPDVVLGMQGDSLVDLTPKCRSYFDNQIKMLKSDFSQSEIRNFRSNRIHDEFRLGEIKGYVLKIIFCLLYTGQKIKARRALADMWPAKGNDELWAAILKRRSEGVLAQTAHERVER